MLYILYSCDQVMERCIAGFEGGAKCWRIWLRRVRYVESFILKVDAQGSRDVLPTCSCFLHI